MGMRRWVWLLVLPAAVVLAQPKSESTSSEEKAIQGVVENYFKGFVKADLDMLGESFHPECDFFRIGESGDVKKLSVTKWYDGLKKFPPGVMEKLNPKTEILSIGVEGSAACVKTRLTFPQNIYTDFLTLLKVNGKWTIVTKTLSMTKIAPKTKPAK